MKRRMEVKCKIGDISLSEYTSWDDNSLISELQKMRNKCKNKCRMTVEVEYGYYNDKSYSLSIYDVRPENDEEYKVRTAKEKEEHKKWKMEEIERAKEVLRKAGVKEV